MSLGISINDLPEQSTTVPSQEQFDGHGMSEKQSPVFDFTSSKPVNEIIMLKCAKCKNIINTRVLFLNILNSK